MGWQERDYGPEFEQEQASRGRLRWPPPAARALLFLHVLAFLALALVAADRSAPVGERFTLGPASLQPLAIATHPLGSLNPLSLIAAIIGIWWLGCVIEPRIGMRKFVLLYVVANLAGGTAYFATARLSAAAAVAPLDYPLGALAAWCWTAGRLLRYEQVNLFGRIVRGSTAIAIFGGIAAALVVLPAGLGGLAWLAAAAAGIGVACAAEAPISLSWPRRRVRPSRVSEPRPRPSASLRRSSPRKSADETPDETVIDEILAKISRSGMQSLTPGERDALESARRAKLRESERATLR